MTLQAPSAQEPQAGSARARILLLHSHYEGYAWSDSVGAGVARVLRESDISMDFSIAYLDSRRTLDDPYVESFRRYLDVRFLGQRFDLVIASDNEALAFIASYRGEGVLSSAPVVFCGINDYRPSLTEGLPEATGITEETAMLETVEATLALRPSARRIVVLVGDNPSAAAIEQAFKDEVEKVLSPRYAFTYERGRDLASLAAIASSRDVHDIIVLLNISRDSRGNTMDPREVARAVSSASPVPVCSFWDFYLGNGILCGRITSGDEQGAGAARLGLRILHGERASSIHVERGVPGPLTFDWRRLEAFDIDESSLPPGSVVIEKPPSFWERYGPVLAISGLVIGVLLVFAAALLSVIARMRVVERRLRDDEDALRNSLRERETLLREVHHRVKNNLQVIASLLNLAGSDIGDGPGAERLRASRSRIEAMATVHEELYDSENFSSVDLSELIRRIAARLEEMYLRPDIALHLPRGSGPHLPLDLALPTALILDELIGNSLAHAFPNRMCGAVTVQATAVEREIMISVVDNGIGLPSGMDPYGMETLGFLIVRSLRDQLGGELDFRRRDEGFEACVRFNAGADA